MFLILCPQSTTHMLATTIPPFSSKALEKLSDHSSFLHSKSTLCLHRGLHWNFPKPEDILLWSRGCWVAQACSSPVSREHLPASLLQSRVGSPQRLPYIWGGVWANQGLENARRNRCFHLFLYVNCTVLPKCYPWLSQQPVTFHFTSGYYKVTQEIP